MTTVGLRQLKNQLSAYVRRAAAGETIAVTDRGKVVAELVPPAPAAAERRGARAQLVRAGIVRPATKPKTAIPKLPNVLKGTTVAELLDWVRGER
jgi:prevent-host-death family protein